MPKAGANSFYVFEGCLTLVMDEQVLRFSAGEFYMYASNRPHAYRNEGEGHCGLYAML